MFPSGVLAGIENLTDAIGSIFLVEVSVRRSRTANESTADRRRENSLRLCYPVRPHIGS